MVCTAKDGVVLPNGARCARLRSPSFGGFAGFVRIHIMGVGQDGPLAGVQPRKVFMAVCRLWRKVMFSFTLERMQVSKS